MSNNSVLPGLRKRETSAPTALPREADQLPSANCDQLATNVQDSSCDG